MIIMKKLIPLAIAAFIIVSCSDSKTTTEEKTETNTMDSTSKVVEDNTKKLDEQTKKVEDALEKLDKEFEKEDK